MPETIDPPVEVTTDVSLCGWRVRSQLPIPELPGLMGEERQPSVKIALKASQDGFRCRKQAAALLEIGDDDSCRLDLPSVATYFVRGGSEVDVIPRPGVAMAEVRAFLLGPVLSLLCLQRGVLPLHGSCIRSEEAGTVLCGPSGTGASTLAAGLCRHGYSVQSDDITAIDMAGSHPVALPISHRLKLWQDCLNAHHIAADGMPRTRTNLARFYYPGDREPGPVRDPVPIRRIIALQRSSGGAAKLDRLDVPTAVLCLHHAVSQYAMAREVGLNEWLSDSLTLLAKRIPVYRLSHPVNLTELQRCVELVLYG